MSNRAPNTDRYGRGFTSEKKLAVWKKAKTLPGQNPEQVRKDKCGAIIHYKEYGKASANGWEIDHIKPVSRDGGDEMANLQPLQWRNNRKKGNGLDTLSKYCEVTS